MSRHSLVAVTVVVPDYDEAIAWFTGVLGFQLTADEPRENGKRWVTVRPSGSACELLLARAANARQSAAVGGQTGGRVAFFLHTDDWARDHADWTAKGVRFVEGPRYEPYGTVGVFEDHWGNRWDLIQPA
ncbi:MAG: VOC family protein [Caulobacteraceae bacterium]|nr:VOC family protein [Caulobacteraceae bacterium]